MNPPVNSSTKPIGLQNVGATCYMNAVLQCLFHVKNLTNELFQYQYFPFMKFALSYMDVITQLSNNSIKVAVPLCFKNVISVNPLFRGIQANDSKDLILYFFENIENELTLKNYICQNPKYMNRIKSIKNVENQQLMNIINVFENSHKSVISDLFYGFKSNSIECLTCHQKLLNYQIFNIIIFPIEIIYNSFHDKTPYKSQTEIGRRNYYTTSNNSYGNFYNDYNNFGNDKYKTNIGYRSGFGQKKVTIYECFDNEISDTDFNGDNQVFCNRCKKMTDSLGKNKIYSSPHVLVLILDRGKGNKFDCDVEFYETIDIKKYVESQNCPVKYNLIGVITHLGESSMSGHFIADCKHFDGKWYTFNDSIVSGPYSSYQKHGTPYILFYQNSEL